MRVIRESINEFDSKGNKLSQEQIEYFKNSKVRDNQGRLFVCYHGTPTPVFNEFGQQRSKTQFGNYKFDEYNVNYFTTDLQSASSYTEMGYEEKGNVYYCYVDIRNPFIVDNKSLAKVKSSFNIKDERIRKRQIIAFDRLWNKYEDTIPTKDDVEDINKMLRPLGCKLEEEDNEVYNVITFGNNSVFGSSRPILYEYSLEELFDSSMYNEVREGIIGEDEDDYYLSTDDIVRVVIAMNEEDGTNYDGILIDDIVDSKSMFSTSATDVITLKSSNQIKLISNKKPTISNKIDESLHITDAEMYIADNEYDIIKLLKNKPKEYRILYDKNIDKYMVGTAQNCIHRDLFDSAIDNGYYHKTNKDNAINYFYDGNRFDKENYFYYGTYGEIEDEDVEGGFKEFGEYLYFIMFSPYEEDAENWKYDDYDIIYKSDTGYIGTRDSNLEEIQLYNLFKNIERV